MSLFTAAMKMCDDCDRNDRPLAWWGPHIRICVECRAKRDVNGVVPQSLASEQVDVRGMYPDDCEI